MRVWLASFPRSGNTFARFVLKELYGLASDTAYPSESGGRLARFLADAGAEAPPDRLRFTKTHEIVAADDASPGLYVVRDGRDAYVSYAHFARQTDPGSHSVMSFEDVLRMLVGSPDHFGGWSRHVDTWTRLAHTAVLFLRGPSRRYRRGARACVRGARYRAARSVGPTDPDRRAPLERPVEFSEGTSRDLEGGNAGGHRDAVLGAARCHDDAAWLQPIDASALSASAGSI